MSLLKTLLVEEHEQTHVGARPFIVSCPRCGRSSKGTMQAKARGRASSWRWGNAEAAVDAALGEARQEVADETLALISLVRCPGCLRRLPAAQLRLAFSLVLESLWFGTLCGGAAGVVIKIAVEETLATGPRRIHGLASSCSSRWASSPGGRSRWFADRGWPTPACGGSRRTRR